MRTHETDPEFWCAEGNRLAEIASTHIDPAECVAYMEVATECWAAERRLRQGGPALLPDSFQTQTERSRPPI